MSKLCVETFHKAFMGDKEALTELYLAFYDDIRRLAQFQMRKYSYLELCEDDLIQDLSLKFVYIISALGRKYRRESGEGLSQ